MGAFEYRQALEVRDVFARHVVRYLFIGKSGAIPLGYPDTTQDADLFLQKSPQNGRAVVAALCELGFGLIEAEAADITGRRFPRLPSRRHHCQQSRGESRERFGKPPPPSGVSCVLDVTVIGRASDLTRKERCRASPVTPDQTKTCS